MRRSVVRPTVMPSEPAPFSHQARSLALHHGDRILREVPTTLRRVGLFVLVMTIAIPAFLAGLLIVLWRLGG